MSISHRLLIYLMFFYIKAFVPLPKPKNIIQSNNFNHTLHWCAGMDMSPGTVYSISIKKSGNFKEKKTALEMNLNCVTVDISKDMMNIFETYIIHIWEELGNRSSSAEIMFTPYTTTIIGPPNVMLSGCGDCLNISISLPKGVAIKQSTEFYKSITFNIHWKEAGDKKINLIGNQNPINQQHNMTLSTYTYLIAHLQPGKKYCVQAEPRLNSNTNTRTSDWFCAFTSTVQQGGGLFVISWTVIFLLLGFSLLTIIAFLAYAGFLCNLRSSLPKALTSFVSRPNLIPQEAHLSVVEFESSRESSKPKHHLQIEESNCEEEQENDDDEGEKEEDGDCKYMHRPANDLDSQTTSSGQSSGNTAITLCDDTDDSERYSVGFSPTETNQTPLTVSQLPVSFSSRQEALANLKTEKTNPPKTKEMEAGGLLKEAEGGASRNINLFSVILTSVQLEDEEVDEGSDAQEVITPLLPTCRRETEESRICLSKPQPGKPPLVCLQTHFQFNRNSQTDLQSEQKDSDMSSEPLDIHEGTQIGYMATHMGKLETENDCFEEEEEEEEEYCSRYMGR